MTNICTLGMSAIMTPPLTINDPYYGLPHFRLSDWPWDGKWQLWEEENSYFSLWSNTKEKESTPSLHNGHKNINAILHFLGFFIICLWIMRLVFLSLFDMLEKFDFRTKRKEKTTWESKSFVISTSTVIDYKMTVFVTNCHCLTWDRC